MRIVLAFVVVLLTARLSAAQDNAEAMKKGTEAIGKACQACHGNIARMLQVEHRTAAQWRNTVFSMIGRGAHIFPDEIDPLVAFLTASHGPSTASSPASAARVLPAGDGKSILERACQLCHSLETATKTGPRDWPTVVSTMATYGAAVTPAEQKTLIEYLQKLVP
jgi:cytochrome c2